MDQSRKNILIFALVIILSGIVGFYGGRYYEQNVVRKRFQSRMQTNLRQNNRESSNSFLQPPMDGNGPRIRMQARP
ncbi:hypothetical protein GYA27_03650 [candidate division WWE3 bacterium]|uniref:Uncharacterized protein n=1 Tax=candidate division WWE3 bacterium TaxID=2053526 RepID=A0A7X9HH60_UNCKA|nr:hypothetical protein [candidate division WWE3 bacterium]